MPVDSLSEALLSPQDLIERDPKMKGLIILFIMAILLADGCTSLEGVVA